MLFNRAVVCSTALLLSLFDHAMALPEAPAGFNWKLNKNLSDEFNDTSLDASMWYDHIPDWEGRPPGKFMPSAIRLKEGSLQIKCAPMEHPQGKFNLACGAIQSKTKATLNGYYECRMKASKLTTSSNIWLVNGNIHLPDGTLKQELIVQFTLGNSKAHRNQMKSNALSAFKSNEPGAKRTKAKKTNQIKLHSGVADEFHTYGCWWVDANTLKFYVDGEYVYTIHPATTFDERPFRHPLSLTIVCETFDWVPLPTLEELNDPDRNTTYVDYVRSYTLTADDDFKHLFSAKLLLRRLEAVNLTPQQLDEFNQLSRTFKADVLEIREHAGITKELIQIRDEAYSSIRKTDLQGEAIWLELQKQTGISDEQREAFKNTKLRGGRFKKDVMAILTPEQRTNLPKPKRTSKP